MTDFVVGEGMQAALDQYGDEARSDEQFVIMGPEGDKISRLYGRDAVYTWMQRDNAVKRLPFR